MSNSLSAARRPLRRSRLAAALGLALGLGVLAAAAGTQAPDAGLLAQYQARYVEHFGSLQGFDDFLAAARADPRAPPMHQTQGATRYVMNCNDAGADSLRAMLAVAQDGDVINLAHCDGVIELQSSLATNADNLIIDGVTATDGNVGNILLGDDNFRILQHNGSGTLELRNLTLAHGRMRDGVARGGCISSVGAVTVRDSVLKYCEANRSVSSSTAVRGGAIYARGGVVISGTSIRKSRAANAYGDALGGAIFAGDGISLVEADIADNVASSLGGLAAGGGIYVAGGAINTVTDSNIRDNRTSSAGAQRGGGIAAEKDSGWLRLQNSLVSGNTMNSDNAFGGGIFVDTGASLAVKYSTVTANKAGQGGGIFSRSGLSLAFSGVDHNSASVKGGAIIAHSGAVKLESCAIDHNKAGRIGGSELNTTSGSVISIEQCTITGNQTADALNEDWGFGTGLVLLKDTELRNSTVTDNRYYPAPGELDEFTPGYLGVGITLDAHVHLEISSSVMMRNSRFMADRMGSWQANLAMLPNASWGGTHNAVETNGAGIQFGYVPPGNVELSPHQLRLNPLSDNGGWTRTMLPMGGSGLINAGLANGFAWDQRGEPHARVVSVAADIGAAESVYSDAIFRDGFDGEL